MTRREATFVNGATLGGNRVDRFLACVAYLDGENPSVVMCRGYYDHGCPTVLVAYDVIDNKLVSVGSSLLTRIRISNTQIKVITILVSVILTATDLTKSFTAQWLLTMTVRVFTQQALNTATV